MKTQKEINEIADAYYEGMADVIEQIESIDKLEQTNRYMEKRYGQLPTNDESELIIEITDEQLKNLKPFPAKYKFMMFGFAMIIGSYIVVENKLALVMFTLIGFILGCTGIIIYHLENIVKDLKR